MKLIDYVVIFIVVAIIGVAIAYIVKAKKSGQKCIGCPNAKNCVSSCGGNCSGCHAQCNCEADKK